MNDQSGPARVDPGLIFGISLITALVISWPGFSGAMNGSADIVAVGVRFLIAVAVVWTGLWIVTSVIAGFAAAVPARPESRSDHEPGDTALALGGSALGGPARAGPTSARQHLGDEATLPATLEAEAAAAIAAETEHVAG